MNNYRDTFIKPEYLHYFKQFSNFQDIVIPAKKLYSKTYKLSIFDFDVVLSLIKHNNNLRYVWKTKNIENDIFYPIINNIIGSHIKNVLNYMKSLNISIYSYKFSERLHIGHIIGKNGTNIRYLMNRIKNICKCSTTPNIEIDHSSNILYIHFKNNYIDFEVEILDQIINEYLMDFTRYT